MFRFLFDLLYAAYLFSLFPLSFDLFLSLALSPSTMHTSCKSTAMVIIKVVPPYCSYLSLPLFLFIRLLGYLLNFSSTFSLISWLYFFNTELSNAIPICLLLIIYSFLPDISRLSLIRSPTFISASSSGSRVWSRIGITLEEDLEPSFLTVSAFRLRWDIST